MWPFESSYPERAAHEVAGREYDYIVVGGGTAGCAVASRLSEDPNVSVLVLEKGRVGDHWLSRVPLLSGSLGRIFQIVHRFSEPIDTCGGRKTDLWTGEAFGGASRINQMLYTRGVPGMYNKWAEMGHPDWSWEKVEPFFRRIENCVSHPNARHLGHDGQVHIMQYPPQFEIYEHIDKSASSMGLPIERDVNDPHAAAGGYFHLDYTIDANGHRHSSYRAYLDYNTATARKDRLTVCTGVIALSLELDVSRGIATGVHIQPAHSLNNQRYLVKAKREVIICSGAVCSPQLLMLSGIGPAAHLESRGITVQRDLPGVGANLSDHHGIPLMLKVPAKESYHYMELSWLWAIWQVILFLWNGTGWLKSGTTSSTIYLNTQQLDPETSTLMPAPGDPELDSLKAENVPDLEIMVIPAGTMVGQFAGISVLSLYTVLVQPKTVGYMELSSTDPTANPIIHYKMLEDHEDVVTARRALRFSLALAEQFMETSGYRHPVELFYAPNADSKRNWRDLSDDDLDVFIRKSIQSVVHLGCTCRMAKEEDGGVVDDALRVYGFTNLRIADASVFAKIPAAHTMAPTYMVAERCAQFVKDTWRSKS